jgi:hypothetical protein
MTAHMGMFEVKDQVYGFMGISPAATTQGRRSNAARARGIGILRDGRCNQRASASES